MISTGALTAVICVSRGQQAGKWVMFFIMAVSRNVIPALAC